MSLVSSSVPMPHFREGFKGSLNISSENIKKGYSQGKEFIRAVALPVFVAHTWKILPAPVALAISGTSYLIAKIAERIFLKPKEANFSNWIKYGVVCLVASAAIYAAAPLIAGAAGLAVTGAAITSFWKTTFVASLIFSAAIYAIEFGAKKLMEVVEEKRAGRYAHEHSYA